MIEFGGQGPTLVLGASLGTGVEDLWAPVLPALIERHRVVGWDLPGHGTAPSRTEFSFEDLAAEIPEQVAGDFAYAGISAGGAVGLHLALRAPERVTRATLICTGARIGTPEAWEARAELVEREGTAAVVPVSASRWFAPGFAGGDQLLAALPAVDTAGYAATCRALAAHDVRGRLGEIRVPVTAVAGSLDRATPPATVLEIADGVPGASFVVIDGAAHLPTIENPAAVLAALQGL